MRTLLLLIFCFTILLNMAAQECETRQIKLDNQNGETTIFDICIGEPPIKYEKGIIYYWYSESLKEVKASKNGARGPVLHGRRVWFMRNDSGPVRYVKDYWFGMEHGEEILWHKNGDTAKVFRFNKGDMVYQRNIYQKIVIREVIGREDQVGTVNRYYSLDSVLQQIDTIIYNKYRKAYLYYENQPNKIKEICTGDVFGKIGSYTKYYENGQIEIEGCYANDRLFKNQKDGIWKWYNEEGILVTDTTYKTFIKNTTNQIEKESGGYKFDKSKNQWIKTGNWRLYNEEGKYMYQKRYP